MTTFPCKMCGGELGFEPGTSAIECPYCGSAQTVPKLTDDITASLYERASRLRRNNEYDKAAAVYEKILLEDMTDAEAYWSLVLCRYGVEYVEDPATHRRVPTVNRTQLTSVMTDENFKSAIQHAQPAQQTLYREEAAAIDEIQKGIRAVSQQEEPFDVFICYKETDEHGRRTPDSVLANELYHGLIKEGFKVFFSRITLEDKLGTAYEPCIFAALNSARVMVVLGTKPEYFNAVWVRNEWSRYLALIKGGAEKTLVPAYRDMNPYHLPEEFSYLQALDMSQLGFMQDLIRGVKKLTGRYGAENAAPIAKPEPALPPASGREDIEKLLKAAFIALVLGDWDGADKRFDEVIRLEPDNTRAFLGKMMAELHVHTQDELGKLDKPFDGNKYYQVIMLYGDKTLSEALRADTRRIRERAEQTERTASAEKTVRPEPPLNDGAKPKPEAPPADQPSPAASGERFGSVISFGHYKLESVKVGGMGPIEWIVIARDEVRNRSLLLSKYCLDTMPFHHVDAYPTWALSDMRAWLNGSFIKTAFTADERKRIVPTSLSTPAYKGRDGGEDTVDRVFLLSREEIALYLGSNAARRACPTNYVVGRGAYHSADHTPEGVGYCWWWLRSPGFDAYYASNVISNGAISGSSVYRSITVRPALWLDMNDGVTADDADDMHGSQEKDEHASVQQTLKSPRADELMSSTQSAPTAHGETRVRPEPAARSVPSASLCTRVGSTVNYGLYRHLGIGDGKPVQWLVLAYDRAANRSLLISKYCLDARQYHHCLPYPTWEKSDIRAWLNDDFISEVFSPNERQRIVMSAIATLDPDGQDGGCVTIDGVFLLSREEALQYFSDDAARKAIPTEYAVTRGVYFNAAHTHESAGCCWWWLRSPGLDSNYAARVDTDGTLGVHHVSSYSVAVRPAFWLDVSML